MTWAAWMHAGVVHFPIGLLIAGTAYETVLRRSGLRRRMPSALWWAGVAGAWAACATGWWSRQQQIRDGLLAEPAAAMLAAWHMALALAAALAYSAVTACRLRRPEGDGSIWQSLGLLLLLMAAHLGGLLAHG